MLVDHSYFILKNKIFLYNTIEKSLSTLKVIKSFRQKYDKLHVLDVLRFMHMRTNFYLH